MIKREIVGFRCKHAGIGGYEPGICEPVYGKDVLCTSSKKEKVSFIGVMRKALGIDKKAGE